ncbi:MAG: Lrp/AsnC family transcriptional regulator [Planctomycetes bacterium]|nr:Lrp/AsnC family transcriptional regulator [Planctomycetota bacterium]
MEKTLNALERKILGAIQYGMPMSLLPFQDLSETVGISTDELLEILRTWKAQRKIRRLGAIVNHFRMGHGVGAMVVWNVPEDRTDQVGQLLASFPKVSHAYLRPSSEQWPYNLYTMVHASDASELEATIKSMSLKSEIHQFRQLKTVRELKKVPPTYIIEQ